MVVRISCPSSTATFAVPMHDRTPPAFDPDRSILAVKYEYDMAMATAARLMSGKSYDPAEQFAILEAFLVHARNLYDFFLPRRDTQISDRAENPNSRNAGSVWAHDFLPGFGVEVYEREVIEANFRL